MLVPFPYLSVVRGVCGRGKDKDNGNSAQGSFWSVGLMDRKQPVMDPGVERNVLLLQPAIAVLL